MMFQKVAFKTWRSWIWGLGLLLGSALIGFCQTPSDTVIRSREIKKETASPRDTMGWPEEEEFGALMELKKAKAWYLMPYVSAEGYWTSNVLLANKGEKGDSVFSETQGILAGYRLSADWNLNASYAYQMLRYAENPVLDVDVHSVGCSSTYQLPWNFQATAGLNGVWVDSPDLKTQVYRENNPYVALTQNHSFLHDRLLWYYGYQFDQKWAHPIGFDRMEHSLYTGFSYVWLPSLVTQLGVRHNWQFYDFRPPEAPVNGRQEWVSSLVVQAVWQPLSFLQVTAYGLTAYDNSENSNRDYKVANCGGNLRFFWRF